MFILITFSLVDALNRYSKEKIDVVHSWGLKGQNKPMRPT